MNSIDKRTAFEWVFNALAGVMESWNDLQRDDDRGRGNDLLCLVLAEDGSGQIGTIYDPDAQVDMNPQEGGFHQVSDWVKFFDGWIDEAEWRDAKPDTAQDLAKRGSANSSAGAPEDAEGYDSRDEGGYAPA